MGKSRDSRSINNLRSHKSPDQKGPLGKGKRRTHDARSNERGIRASVSRYSSCCKITTSKETGSAALCLDLEGQNTSHDTCVVTTHTWKSLDMLIRTLVIRSVSSVSWSRLEMWTNKSLCKIQALQLDQQPSSCVLVLVVRKHRTRCACRHVTHGGW